MITSSDVFRTYSGKPGCMCGCLGDYKDSERAKKSAITRLLKDDYRLQLWEGDSDDVMGCIYVQTETRNNVIYLRKGTELPMEMLLKVEWSG
jgi:hypothetical protein